MFRLFRRDREKGASAVEFAIVLPLLVLLVFGIMEAGWLFAQQVEVRNAAREGARLAVVDEAASPGSSIRTKVCQRAPLSDDRAQVTIVVDSDTATVTVEQDYASLTGVIPSFNAPITIASTVKMRLEREISSYSYGPEGCSP
jgi:Flp pilus assembly protein TadG